MKRVILTCGPRGAGKTTYSKRIAKMCPQCHIVSRDAIAIEHFGSVYLSPYLVSHEFVQDKAYAMVSNILQTTPDNSDVTIIFDYWNGSPIARKRIVRELRTLGVESVWAWYFVTPRKICVQQFIEREQRQCDSAFVERDFDEFHAFANDLINPVLSRENDAAEDAWRIDGLFPMDSFDAVIIINPAQYEIPVFS